MEKAQIAIEAVLVFALALTIIGVLYGFTFSNASDNIAISKTQAAVDTLGRNVDYIYSLNKGSSTSVEIDIPAGAVNYTLTSKTINYKVGISSGFTDVFYITKTNLTGRLPISEGKYIVYINNTGGDIGLAY